MDDFLKDNLKNCLNFLKSKINASENYQLIEKKRKIYYFSKFSLDVDEFYLIYQTVKKIKENVFKNMLDCLKFCAKEIVTFTSEKSDREKILILFSICYLHFYTNFSYENNFRFEEFYNQDLVNLCTKYKVLIIDIKQFKVFSYSFYEQIIKEINKIDYASLKLHYNYYNPVSLESQKLVMENNKSKSIFEICKFYFKKINQKTNDSCFNNFYKIQNLMHNKLFKPLISTTERVVDMVLSIDPNSKNLEDDGNIRANMQNNFNNVFNINSKNLEKYSSKRNSNTSNDNIVKVSIDRTKPSSNLQNDQMIILDTDSNYSDNNHSTSTTGENIKIAMNAKNIFGKENAEFNEIKSQNNMQIDEQCSSKPIFSKRILCELIKSDDNQAEEQIIYDIGQKLDDLIEMILNKSDNKINFIQFFICYIVEINSELIRYLPEFQNITDDIYIRYIISAKNIYNYAIEIYFSIHDMFNIDLDTFMDVFSKKFPNNNDDNLARNILSFYKIITSEFSKNKDLSVYEIFQNLFTTITSLWDKEIVEKGQELTRFYAI